jgi:hypothetical protein
MMGNSLLLSLSPLPSLSLPLHCPSPYRYPSPLILFLLPLFYFTLLTPPTEDAKVETQKLVCAQFFALWPILGPQRPTCKKKKRKESKLIYFYSLEVRHERWSCYCSSTFSSSLILFFVREGGRIRTNFLFFSATPTPSPPALPRNNHA